MFLYAFACLEKDRPRVQSAAIGGQKGWRLPSVHKLSSLVDLKNAGGNPDSPPGYPVTNVLNKYWPATTNVENSTNAWNVTSNNGNVNNDNKINSNHAWCVRGGMHIDSGVQAEE